MIDNPDPEADPSERRAQLTAIAIGAVVVLAIVALGVLVFELLDSSSKSSTASPATGDGSSTVTSTTTSSPSTTAASATTTTAARPSPVQATDGPRFARDSVLVPVEGGIADLSITDQSLRWARPLCTDPRWADVVDSTVTDLADVTCGNRLYAISVADGRTRWTLALHGPPDYFREAGATIAIGYPTELDVLDRASGRVRWTRPLGPKGHPMALDGQRLYLAETSDLVALDVATGRTLWTDPIDVGWLTVDGNTLFIRLEGHSMAAVTTSTGADLWTPTPADERLVHSVILGVTDHRVLVRSGTGLIIAYDETTGGEEWSTAAGTTGATARVGDGRLVVQTATALTIIDAAGGDSLSSTPVDELFVPAIADAKVAYISHARLYVSPLPG